MSFDMGKSESQQEHSSQQTSSQGSQSQSAQGIWSGQVPFLEGLYQRGSQLLGQSYAGGTPGAEYQSPAFAAWSRLIGGGGENPLLAQSIKNAQSRAAEGFNENILPGLQTSAISSGNLGGSRGQIAAGIAGRDAQRGQERIATDMGFQDYGQSQQRILQALGMTGGLSGLSASSFAPLSAFAQLLGRPTVLGGSNASSYGTSQGTGSGSADSSSWKFGGGFGP